MSSKLAIAALLVFLLSVQVLPQKLINGFTREFAVRPLPSPFYLKSFDLNNDGIAEVFVTNSRRLIVYDGKTFDKILEDSVSLGTANHSRADVNWDGIPDLVATDTTRKVVVWYGPDFSVKRVFTPPQPSSSFAVRNRDDGQVEFSFGFGHTHTACQPVPTICINTVDGHLLRYLDTAFIFLDSVHLNISPETIFWGETSPTQPSFFTMGHRWMRTCPQFSPCDVAWQFIISGVTSFSGSYGWRDFCGFEYNIGTYAMGNIDSDSGNEFIGFIVPFGWGTCSYSSVFFVRDLQSGSFQWLRQDLRGILALFAVDLNADGIRELISYEKRSNIPLLVEFSSSDTVTLGSSVLPFAPTVLSLERLGSPLQPRVLLGHSDSLVVFKVNAGCSAAKGDMNADGNLNITDLMLEINCVFLSLGNCLHCFADVNCDGALTAADVILQMNAVFLNRPLPCP